MVYRIFKGMLLAFLEITKERDPEIEHCGISITHSIIFNILNQSVRSPVKPLQEDTPDAAPVRNLYSSRDGQCQRLSWGR